MVDGTLSMRDAGGVPYDRSIKNDGPAGGIAPYNAEDPTQRAALLSALAPLAVLAARLPATAWTSDATAQDMRAYADAEVQISGLTGGDTITFTRSIDGTNYVTTTYFADAGTGTVISANGIYGLAGFGYLKWSKAGTASTPTITIRGSN